MAISLSIASTVVLIRNFQQQNLLGTNIGKMPIVWLVVEDILMVLILVLLPVVLSSFHNMALLNPKLYFTLFAIFGINFCYF